MLLKEIFFFNKKIHNQLTNLNIFKNIKIKKNKIHFHSMEHMSYLLSYKEGYIFL